MLRLAGDRGLQHVVERRDRYTHDFPIKRGGLCIDRHPRGGRGTVEVGTDDLLD
jgi:hypothetical protein